MPILANVLFSKMHYNFSHNTCYLLDTCWVSHERKLVQVFTFMKAWGHGFLLKVGPCSTLPHMCLYFNESHNLRLYTTHSSTLIHSLKTMMAYVKVFSMETSSWLWHAWHFLMFPYLSTKGNNGFSQSVSWKACPIL